ncbi:S1 family peptidase [Chryseobacterium indologenes]|nr:serine protease [Chryseobacterium indologenes]ASE61830.1 serine protease [Chryseobacterium indologenes]VFA41402.1 peptidase Do [Chryseobacterium indologenes]
MINHPEQLIDAVCRIKCGEDHGTGFFISPVLIMTANHTIMDFDIEETEIQITLPDGRVHATTIVAQDAYLDVAVLQISCERENETFLPVVLDHIRYNEEWATFGYPFNRLATGQLFQGTVQAHARNLPYDLNLVSVEIDPSTDYSGLSGAPLLIDGKVNGMITWSTHRGLGAVSISKISGFLSDNNIMFDSQIEHSWSQEFDTELEGVVENAAVVSKLMDSLEVNGKYHLLHGAPGSGKSIISSLIEPRSRTKKILGRYLLRTPGDDVPIFVRASKEYFLKWLEDLLSKYITGEPMPRSDMKWNNRLERLLSLLDNVNAQLVSKGEAALIVIDGLDEVISIEQDGLKGFLSMLPERLPSNISILLSCSSQEILPVFIRSQLDDENKIVVTPLDQTVTEAILRQANERFALGLSITQQAQLARKSEGHPLYLHYIVETAKIIEIAGRDAWIVGLPTISGDIKNYYEAIWSRSLGVDSDNYWISLIGSQLRETVEEQEFKLMLPEEVQHNFQVRFPIIRHFFKFGRKIAIYHQSFVNFISTKGAGDIKKAHGFISVHNVRSEGSQYALKNLIHHLLLSENPLPSIAKCNQKWVDDCALIHMEPDRVIADVERVEELCIDKSVIEELVRIKLLLQRLRFRYNTILAKHAFELADAIIEMGDADAALKYIIREDILLISIEDSLYFLQKLFDIGAEKEALQLMDAVNLRFRVLLEKSVETGGLDISLFYLQLKFNTICLSRKNFPTALLKYMKGTEILREISDDEDESDEVRDVARSMRADLEPYQIGYVVYRLLSFPGIEDMSKFSDGVYTADTANVLARAALFYEDFKQKSARATEDSDAFKRLISDIETLVTDHGYNEADTDNLLFALIKETKKSYLLEEMIAKKLTKPVTFNLRVPNGVDPDLDSINLFYQEQIYRGYVDKTGVYPVLVKHGPTAWEGYIRSMYQRCGFLQGKLYRIYSDENFDALPALQKKAQEIFEEFDFSLKERVQFNRCYQLIEDTVALLYHRLLLVFLELGDDSVSWFIERLINLKNTQLGMYTEGYRRTLYEISAALAKNTKQKQNAFKVVRVLEDHVYNEVQNRWEKIPELIEIIGFYAKIGAKSRARFVYQLMLNTSMGPTWYKEGQFGLINSVLRKMDHDKADQHYADFAAYLEYAAGEMTFQRYVQSAMSRFTGTLAIAGHVSHAIEYFKFQILPSAKTILDNVDTSTLDAPIKGDGYILGARSIIEADAMSQFLLSVKGDPLIVFALSEIFIFNEDTDRYIDNFTKVQYQVYQDACHISESYAQEIIDRIAWLLSDNRFSKFKNLYIRSLYRSFKTGLDKLEIKLLSSGIDKSDLPEILPEAKETKGFTKEDDEAMAKLGGPFPGAGKMSNYSQLPEAISKASDEFALENISEGLQILVDCLKVLANDGSDIWEGGNLTKDLGVLFDLFRIHASAEDAVTLLKPFIINHLSDDWYVVSSLLGLLSDKLDADIKETIIIYVKDHIEYIIRSEGDFKEKYEWLSLPISAQCNIDEQLVQFLVWLLNHPFSTVRKKVGDTLFWLSTKKSSLIVSSLIKDSLANDSDLSNEYSGYLLKEMSTTLSKEIWSCLKNDQDVKTDILGLDHTMLQIYWREILENCSEEDEELHKLQQRFGSFFPTDNFDGRDVYIEDVELLPVLDTLYDLNNLNLLNAAYINNLKLQRERLTCDLGEAEHQRVERYIRRSFLEEEIEMGHYHYKLNTAVNKALSGRVSVEQIKEVSEILRITEL